MNFAKLEKIRDVRLEANGNTYRLELFDCGDRMPNASQWRLAYKFSQIQDKKATVLFKGDDYGCSPCDSIDSDASVRGLLTFLTLKPHDTDPEYFDHYTPEQLAWSIGSDCEQIKCDYTIEDDDGQCWGVFQHWKESQEAKNVRKAIHSLWDAKDSLECRFATSKGKYTDQIVALQEMINGLLDSYCDLDSP